MLDRCSYHAVVRYLDRVLGLPVDAWLNGREHLNERLKAEHCCKCAGLPVDAVRELVLCPPVARIVVAGFRQVIVRLDGFAYVIRGGVVVSILTERMRDERIGALGRLKDMNRTELRTEQHKRVRRQKNKVKSQDRKRLIEVD